MFFLFLRIEFLFYFIFFCVYWTTGLPGYLAKLYENTCHEILFSKDGGLNLKNFTGVCLHLWLVFYWTLKIFCEIFHKSYSIEHLWTVSPLMLQNITLLWRLNYQFLNSFKKQVCNCTSVHQIFWYLLIAKSKLDDTFSNNQFKAGFYFYKMFQHHINQKVLRKILTH